MTARRNHVGSFLPCCPHFVTSLTATQLRKCTQTLVMEHKECATRPPKMARKLRMHAGLCCATLNVFCAAIALHPNDSEKASKTTSFIEFACLAAAHNRAARAPRPSGAGRRTTHEIGFHEESGACCCHRAGRGSRPGSHRVANGLLFRCSGSTRPRASQCDADAARVPRRDREVVAHVLA